MPLSTLLVMLLASLLAVVHFLFARAIRTDGDRLELLGQGTWFVAPVVWSAATLLGGVLTVAVYWLLHHSSLSVQRRPPGE